jgi:Radical SAM superfamily
MKKKLNLVIVKPSKYGLDGFVERFRWGFMPNSTVPYIRSMTPKEINGTQVEVHTIDEYVLTDLAYLKLLVKKPTEETLLALVGVQSHQFHRALDLAAYARQTGCLVVIGGPHPMTCDTSMLQGQGVSFAMAEAELVWQSILSDACSGELQPRYGTEQRWQRDLEAPVVIPPSPDDLRRYFMRMLGLYPARGCPFLCNYCSVIKIAGRMVRSQSIETTIASLKAAKAAGVKLIMFTSDNFNKYANASELLETMIEEKIDLPFLVQCDTQIAKQEGLVELLSRAGCFQMFLGIESFDRQTLIAARKTQNRPELYDKILQLCRRYGIYTHFSTIIGFPHSTAEDIKKHTETLCGLNPTWASFYILCPIPGTEQYADFLSQGLIVEKNLDRFDCTCLTWKHPSLSAGELQSLMFKGYRRFESLRHTTSNVRHLNYKRGGFATEALTTIGYTVFNRYSALRKNHPMSGGIRRTRLDHIDDFLHLRRKCFGLEIVPLPQNLALPQTDQILNRIADRTLQRGLTAVTTI